jgi:hypothetical protein
MKDPKENDELALLYCYYYNKAVRFSPHRQGRLPQSRLPACLWEHGLPNPSRVLELLAKSLEVFVVDWCMLL